MVVPLPKLVTADNTQKDIAQVMSSAAESTLSQGTVFFTKNGVHPGKDHFFIYDVLLELTLAGDAFKGVIGRLFPVVGIGESNTHLQVILRPDEFIFTQHTYLDGGRLH